MYFMKTVVKSLIISPSWYNLFQMKIHNTENWPMLQLTSLSYTVTKVMCRIRISISRVATGQWKKIQPKILNLGVLFQPFSTSFSKKGDGFPAFPASVSRQTNFVVSKFLFKTQIMPNIPGIRWYFTKCPGLPVPK